MSEPRSNGERPTQHERLKADMHYEPDTGIFTRLRNITGKALKGTRAGCASTLDRRWVIRFEGKVYKASRLAWFYMTGAWPVGLIDHINCDCTDDRFANLRDVDHRTNGENHRRPGIANSTGFLGVSKSLYWKRSGRQWWNAAIKADGKSYNLGKFATPELAHEAYLEAKRRLHAGCTL